MHIKKFGRRALITQKEFVDGTSNFNDEELYYMNRIAFRLLKQKGVNLRFDKFVRDLKTLQSGSFQNRLWLWLKCVCEIEEDI